MDGDSWSARLSSASKRYQSALQSRSGELDFELFFWWGCLVAEKMGEKFLVMGIWSLGSWLFVMWVMEKVKFL